MTVMIDPLPRRQCGTCEHWGMITIVTDTGTHCVPGPSALPHDGVIVRTCGRGSEPGLVVNGIAWCRGGDTCSKWRRA